MQNKNLTQIKWLAAVIILCGIFQNSVQAKTVLPAEAIVQEIKIPAKAQAMTPFFLKEEKRLWMLWQEPAASEGLWRLRLAYWQGEHWSAAKTVFESDKFMRNWADFPKLQRGGDGFLYSTWLESAPAPKSHGYFVHVARSSDQGDTWKKLGVVHQDRTADAEHGFVSLASVKEGVRAFWLDGGKAAVPNGKTELRTALIADKVSSEKVVDADVCSCCGTLALNTDQGPTIFYRGRSSKDIRDIHFSTITDKSVWQNAVVSADQWEIHGCPVNGPSADRIGDDMVVAWYTGGGPQPGVKAAFFNESTKSFLPAIKVNDFLQGSMGRVKVVLLDSQQALAVWLKSRADGDVDIYARRVSKKGQFGSPVRLLVVKGAKRIGFPQVALWENSLVMAWTKSESANENSTGIGAIQVELSQFPQIGQKEVLLAKRAKTTLGEGEHLTEISATDLSGKKVDLAQLKGRSLLINFWASWCDACVEELEFLRSLDSKYQKRGLEVVLVNVDQSEDWPQAQKILDKDYKELHLWKSSPAQSVGQFGYSALPYTILVDRDGMLRKTITGSLLKQQKNLDQHLSELW